MPKIPTPRELGLGRVKSNVGGTPSQNLTTTPAMFGETSAKNLMRTSKGMMDASAAYDVYQKHRGETNDLTQKLSVEAAILKFEADKVTNGYLTEVMTDAFQNEALFDAAWKKSSQQFLQDKDKNPIKFYSRQEEDRVKNTIEMAGIRMKSKVMFHANEQRDKYAIVQLVNREENIINSGSYNYADENQRIQDLAALKNTVKERLKRQGMSAEEVEVDGIKQKSDVALQTEKTISAYHHKSIRGALSTKDAKDLVLARKLHNDAMEKNEITGEEAITLLKEMNAATILTVAQKHAKDAFALFTDEASGFQDEKKAGDWLNKKLKGDDYIKAMSMYNIMVKSSRATRNYRRTLVSEKHADVKMDFEKLQFDNQAKAPDLVNDLYEEHKDDPSAGFTALWTDKKYIDNPTLRKLVSDGFKERIGDDDLTDKLELEAKKRTEANRKLEEDEKHRKQDVIAQRTGVDVAREYFSKPSRGAEIIAARHVINKQEPYLYVEAMKHYYASLKDMGMSADHIEQLRKIDEGKLTAIRQKKGDIARDKYVGISEEAMKNAADEEAAYNAIPDDLLPETRILVEARIKAMYAMHARVQLQNEKELLKSGREKFLAGKFTDMTAEENNAIDKYRGLRDSLTSQFQRKANGTPIVSKRETENKLWTMLREDSVAFNELNLFKPEWAGNLSQSDLNKFLLYQINVDKEDVKQKERVEKLSSALGIAKRYLKPAGIKAGSKKEALFQTALMDEIEKMVDDPTLDLTQRTQRVTDVVLGLLLHGEQTDTGMFTFNVGGVEIGDEDDIRMYQAPGAFKNMDQFESENKETLDRFAQRSNVPRKEITGVVSQIIKLGAPTTIRNIKAMWEGLLEIREERKNSAIQEIKPKIKKSGGRPVNQPTR